MECSCYTEQPDRAARPAAGVYGATGRPVSKAPREAVHTEYLQPGSCDVKLEMPRSW